MIIEYIRYTIPVEKADEFVGAYTLAAIELRDSEHCLGYELSRCVEDQTHFILRIEWDSEAGHLQGFRKSEGFKAFFAAIKPYFEAIEEMNHYTVTAVRAVKGGLG